MTALCNPGDNHLLKRVETDWTPNRVRLLGESKSHRSGVSPLDRFIGIIHVKLVVFASSQGEAHWRLSLLPCIYCETSLLVAIRSSSCLLLFCWFFKEVKREEVVHWIEVFGLVLFGRFGLVKRVSLLDALKSFLFPDLFWCLRLDYRVIGKIYFSLHSVFCWLLA